MRIPRYSFGTSNKKLDDIKWSDQYGRVWIFQKNLKSMSEELRQWKESSEWDSLYQIVYGYSDASKEDPIFFENDEILVLTRATIQKRVSVEHIVEERDNKVICLVMDS